ncbi:hypothetical protein LO762_07855 [Actinocorallia sp. API 0066]|uniref:hypothetical protein n=1 Tax=Actinocorallia sp. API 0066 TaxID=2896846 RepID=UPI001E305727|nr:hypothetical protein [Actinocorallia sp. API 0066]MCD0449103.1 hypothetical protein [Actinocorallia sp. API 0066]
MLNPCTPYPVVAQNTKPAAWLFDRLALSEYNVASLVPRGYDAYARVLHPAESSDEQPVRWDAIARWSGRELHAESLFSEISDRAPGGQTGDSPFDESPRIGHLPETELAALCALLADHTSTPQTCWFCVWEGWGWLTPERDGAELRAEGPGDEAPSSSSPPAFLTDVLSAPRVRMPTRDYALMTGPLNSVTVLGNYRDGHFFPQSPSIFWPEDHAWCVATEIDLDSTHVAGSADLIAALLSHDLIEAIAATPNDSISAAYK